MFDLTRAAGLALAQMLATLPVSAALAHDDARLVGDDAVQLVHDDHDWIRRGGHLSADGKPCCGKDDCTPLLAERVKQTPEGYALLEFKLVVPYGEALRSEDGRYWLCMTHSTRVRCFFAPPSAM